MKDVEIETILPSNNKNVEFKHTISFGALFNSRYIDDDEAMKAVVAVRDGLRTAGYEADIVGYVKQKYQG